MAYLYLLDRNVVSLIKDSNEGKPLYDSKKTEFLQRLRKLDRAGNYISPLLSIIEGEKGKEDTAEDKAKCQRKESDAVRQFFKFAETDSDYLDSSSEIFASVFTASRESGWPLREEFLRKALPIVGEIVPDALRGKSEAKLIELAHESKLAHGDPALVLLLSCLHGSVDSRRPLKPKKISIYNVLSDLHAICRVGMVKAICEQNDARVCVRIVSRDEGLVGVLSNIRTSKASISANGELQLLMTYGPQLFPDLEQDQYLALLDKVLA